MPFPFAPVGALPSGLTNRIVPSVLRRALRRARRRHEHAIVRTRTRFGLLRRRDPIRRCFGWGAGLCIDRYYIERFLDRHSADVRGRVLEIGDDRYTRRFGGAGVTSIDILHRDPEPNATIVADLADAGALPDESFDCAIVTQTLQYIYDVAGAVRTLERILSPGGTALVSVPGITQISGADQQRFGEYWRFTTDSARRLFADAFGASNVDVVAFGNVATSVAFLHGLVAEELSQEELSYHDPIYPMVITVRARKPASPGTGPTSPGTGEGRRKARQSDSTHAARLG